jgi:Trypsin
MHMNLRRLGVGLLVAAAIGCNTMNESAPPVGESAHAIQDGTLDTDNKFSGVVYLRPLNPASASYSCSGVLVAPRWVLAARHCFEVNGNAAIKADYAVGFGPDSNMRTPEGPIAVHTQAISGDVLIHPSFLRVAPDPHDELSMLDSSQTARDVALLKLDAAVPISVAKHHPLSGASEVRRSARSTLQGSARTWGTVPQVTRGIR